VNLFQNPQELEMFCSDVFSVQLDDIAPLTTNTTYPFRVFKVISWAETQGKLGELIDEIRPRNRGDFCKLVEGQFSEMVKILDPSSGEIQGNNISNFANLILESENVQQAIDSSKSVLPVSLQDDSYFHEIQALEDKKNDKYRLYIVFLLLRDYPRSQDGPSRFSSFIKNFSERIDDAPQLSQKDPQLSQKLKSLFPGIIPLQKKISPAASPGKIESFLKPSAQPKQKLVNAYLLIQLGRDQFSGKDQFHLDACLKINPEEPIPVGLRNSANEVHGQRGTTCTRQEIEEQVVQLIRRGEEVFSDTKENEISFLLIVEIFLPYEYLTEKIDLWRMEQLNEKVPIGSRYNIVLRSWDRIVDKNLKEGLETSWRTLQPLLDPDRKTAPKGWHEYFLHLESLPGSWDFDKKIGVKVTCGLPDRSEDQIELMRKIITTDLPFAIWTRSAELSKVKDLPEEIKQLLDFKNFRDIDQFLKSIQQKRKEANNARAGNGKAEDYLGHHLAFLYDDPSRPFPRPRVLSDSY
jgi:hypothetical protein